MKKASFDFEILQPGTVIRIRHGEALLGEKGILTPLLTEFLKAALEGELQAHNETAEEANRKNRIKTLRARLNRQITALHARSGSYSDIRGHLAELYDREVSTARSPRVFAKQKGRSPKNKRRT